MICKCRVSLILLVYIRDANSVTAAVTEESSRPCIKQTTWLGERSCYKFFTLVAAISANDGGGM